MDRQPTLNERFVSAAIVRQILLMRFSLYVRNMMVDTLNKTEQPIAATVREALREEEIGLRNPVQVAKLEAMLDQLNMLRRLAWETVTTTAEAQMNDLAEVEPEDERHQFGLWLPSLTLTVPIVGVVGAQAIAAPFLGRNLRQWLTDAADAEAKRIRQAVFSGVGAAKSADDVARLIVGSATTKGRDGATQVSRNHIDAVMRSATSHVAAYARDQFRRANAGVQAMGPGGRLVDVFAKELFVAVLDSATTPLCRTLDGRTFPVGEGPIPPLHVNCRSSRVLVLPDELGGPAYDPGTFAAWVQTQPAPVRAMILGRAKDVDLSTFRDYGAKPMSLDQTRAEFEDLMAAY